MWKDVKYLLAYLSPVAAAIGIYMGGWWSPGSAYLAFIIIPLMEFFLPARTDSVSDEQELARHKKRFFDFLLYLNLPILYGLIVLFVVPGWIHRSVCG